MQLLLILLLGANVISASFTDVLDNTSTSLYYMVSRSVVLYLLLVWFTFMYISCISTKSEVDYDSLVINSDLDKEARAPQPPPQPQPNPSPPSAPVYNRLFFEDDDNVREIEHILLDFRQR